MCCDFQISVIFIISPIKCYNFNKQKSTSILQWAFNERDSILSAIRLYHQVFKLLSWLMLFLSKPVSQPASQHTQTHTHDTHSAHREKKRTPKNLLFDKRVHSFLESLYFTISLFHFCIENLCVPLQRRLPQITHSNNLP